jgi:hypothetical protein
MWAHGARRQRCNVTWTPPKSNRHIKACHQRLEISSLGDWYEVSALSEWGKEETWNRTAEMTRKISPQHREFRTVAVWDGRARGWKIFVEKHNFVTRNTKVIWYIINIKWTANFGTDTRCFYAIKSLNMTVLAQNDTILYLKRTRIIMSRICSRDQL